MTTLRQRAIAALACALVCACGGDDDDGLDQPDARTEPDIAERLAAIDGMVVLEQPTDLDGYRYFWLGYQQPADHDDPGGLWFEQRATMIYRIDSGPETPMVLATTGYHVYIGDRRLEITALLDAHQVVLEHRWFWPSRPEPADWSLLTIEQAAADHHRVVEVLRPLFAGPWVSTGHSKGGMTSIYHRRFYPDDVDATVAYVAPNSVGAPDYRYDAFFDDVGDAACRDRVHQAQREVLLRREAMEQLTMELAAAEQLTFDIIGVPAAVESAAVELEWFFWQYHGIEDCADLPDATATDDELFATLDRFSPVDWGADGDIEAFWPYYYQAATQLGYPGTMDEHLTDLIVTGANLDQNPVLPPDVTATYDPSAMTDIAGWVAGDGRQLMFVYGERDPWTAGAFDIGDGVDKQLYVAPGQNHGALLADLPDAEYTAALGMLEAWTGAPIAASAARERARDVLRPIRPRARTLSAAWESTQSSPP